MGALKVPGCLQSADKLAKLIGDHIHTDMPKSEGDKEVNIQNIPFYLWSDWSHNIMNIFIIKIIIRNESWRQKRFFPSSLSTITSMFHPRPQPSFLIHNLLINDSPIFLNFPIRPLNNLCNKRTRLWMKKSNLISNMILILPNFICLFFLIKKIQSLRIW